MISYKYRCIYIHNPKTASISIREYFKNFMAGHNIEICLGHSYVGAYLDRLPHCINMFPTYFTFTFVRNPFDRFVSTWLHRFDTTRWPFNQTPRYNHSLREYAELAKELLIYQSSISFPSDKEIGPHKMPFLDLKFERHHFIRQKDFLLVHDLNSYHDVKQCTKAPCSFIGRYENLERDFSCLLDILGSPNHKLPKANISLNRRVREGKKRHYSDYYDKPTRRLVEDIYADDLELFGYDFEEAGKPSGLSPLYDEEVARARYAHSMKNSVLDALKACQWRSIFFVKSFWDRKFISSRVIKFFFILPLLTFVGLHDIAYRMRRYLKGRTGRIQ